MALSETLCWEVLRSCKAQVVSTRWLKGDHANEPDLVNCLPQFVIERDLVLRHGRQQIEDSMHFLEKRGYLLRHGFQGLTRVAFQLSDDALKALEGGNFLPEEQRAFREALVDLRQPGFWGMKVNLGEAWRRLKKWRK
jgi:hypothetical protein